MFELKTCLFCIHVLDTSLLKPNLSLILNLSVKVMKLSSASLNLKADYVLKRNWF
jgi:hypothetical protein